MTPTEIKKQIDLIKETLEKIGLPQHIVRELEQMKRDLERQLAEK